MADGQEIALEGWADDDALARAAEHDSAAFAELYHLAFIENGHVVSPRASGRVIGPRDRIDLAALIAEFRGAGTR